MSPDGRPQLSGHEHAEVVEAIVAGKALEAKAAAARHVEAVRMLIEAEAESD